MPDYVYKTRPTYINKKLTLRQIHKLDDEYDSIMRQDKLSQADETRLIKIEGITESWAQPDTHATTRRPTHRADILQQTQQQQHKHKARLIEQ